MNRTLFLWLIFFSLFITSCNNNPVKPQNSVSQEDVYLQKISQAMDYTNPVTRDFAISLAAKSPGNFNLGQVCYIYDYLFNNWKYVNDPRGFEYFSSASETIKSNLAGDCDDFAILMASLISAIGGTARISLAFNNTSGHAFTEVCLDNMSPPVSVQSAYTYINSHYQGFFQKLFGISAVESIWYRPDNSNRAWLNLDWSSKYPGGEYFKFSVCTIYYPLEGYYYK